MSYIRVDYKGDMRFVTDDNLMKSIAEDQGQVLVVTGNTLRSMELWVSLLDSVDVQDGSWVNQHIHTQQSTIRVCSPFEWMNYCGLQLSSAYVHMDATLDFLIKIMSKCRLQPKMLQSNNT